MANTIAKATGGDATRTKTTTRLGSQYAEAQANTWRTFATVTTWADGRVTVHVERDGKRLLTANLRSEADTDEGQPTVQQLFYDDHGRVSSEQAVTTRGRWASSAEIRRLEDQRGYPVHPGENI